MYDDMHDDWLYELDKEEHSMHIVEENYTHMSFDQA